MAKKKASRAVRMVEGTLLGMALGVAAGMYLASAGTAELKGRLAKKYADFAKFMVPRLRKMKKVGKKEYDVMVDKAMAGFAELYKLGRNEAASLAKTAKRHFADVSKLPKR